MTIGGLNNVDTNNLSEIRKSLLKANINNTKAETVKPTTEAINQNDKKSINHINETPINPVASGITFTPQSKIITINDKQEPLGITKATGAKVFAHTDSTDKKDLKRTDYLCGHVFRVGTEMKSEGLKYTGFIHMSEGAKENQFFDVLGTGIKGYAEKLSPKNPVDIMVTGFTRFDYVPDNPTGKFLFNDGTSESYGLKNADPQKIDKMMTDKFSPLTKNPEPIYGSNNMEIGRSYTYKDTKTNQTKTINLTFVRLPVDDILKNKKAELQSIQIDDKSSSTITNQPGDYTGDLLKESIRATKPDALISFGAGSYNPNEYMVETISYGMKKEGAKYDTKDKYITNNDLSDIYREQLK